MTDSLGDRMKHFEKCFTEQHLIPRMPAIIRLDGKAFHTFTKDMKKPYSADLKYCFDYACLELAASIQDCKLVYTQSDEVSVLITDYETHETEQWFAGNTMKIVSITASLFTNYFNKYYEDVFRNYELYTEEKASFDCRVFSISKEEVCNYFIWRQKDCERNSINSLGQKHFSHKQLHGLNINEVKQKLLEEKNIVWENVQTCFKRGSCILKGDNGYWKINNEIPIFTQDRSFIEKYV